MTRVLRILAALLTLLALAGAESSCGSGVKSDRPPSDKQVNPAEARKATIRTNSSGPYTVLIISTDQTTGGIDRFGPEPIGGGEFKAEVDYESGARVEIRVLVYGNASDIMQCSITDGVHIDRQRREKECLCLLTTSR